MPNCLIIGGDSVLGSGLARVLRCRGCTVSLTTRRANVPDRTFLDLETLEGLDALASADLVALVAAETKLATCAREPERTRLINVEAPSRLAEWALDKGSRVLFFSSTAVHDMSVDCPAEADPVFPNTAYGKQKHEAEQAIMRLSGDAAIIRPSKIVDAEFALFQGWVRALKAGEPITPFSDYTVSPVFLDLFVEAVATLLLSRGETGIYQISACDETSYEAIASFIAEQEGLEPSLIQPARASDVLSADALLPSGSARVSCARLEALLGRDMPSWRDGVRSFLAAQQPRP